MPAQPRRPIATLAAIGLVIATMITLVSFSVPLYRLFCAATGAGGTTQRVAADTSSASARQVTVFFNTDVAPGLPWRFVPVQHSVVLHLGEQTPAYFEATNLSDHAIVGHATFNVTPDKAGLYFKKIQCFCFTEERLGPHQTVQMPVQFFVDPALATNPDTTDVDQITLSYTFFQSKNPGAGQDLARLATSAAPDAAHGKDLFGTRCRACHGLDTNKIGPALRGVVGRHAGTAPGFTYSAALAHAPIVWTPQTLNDWLINPQVYVPGALMPNAVADAGERRDIIAYLTEAGATRHAGP